MVREVLTVHDRSEPPSGPILGESAQIGLLRPRSLPRRAHHLASAYKNFSALILQSFFLLAFRIARVPVNQSRTPTPKTIGSMTFGSNPDCFQKGT